MRTVANVALVLPGWARPGNRLRRDGRLSLYEAEWTDEPNPRWLASLRETAAILGRGAQQTGELGLIRRTSETLRKGGVV